jgi:hypothetical protein
MPSAFSVSSYFSVVGVVLKPPITITSGLAFMIISTLAVRPLPKNPPSTGRECMHFGRYSSPPLLVGKLSPTSIVGSTAAIRRVTGGELEYTVLIVSGTVTLRPVMSVISRDRTSTAMESSTSTTRRISAIRSAFRYFIVPSVLSATGLRACLQ